MTTPAPPDWTMKRGDLRPSIRAQLTTKRGPVDLTEMESVRFIMDGVDGTTKHVEGAAHVVIDPAAVPPITAKDGWVEYDWKAGDTNVVGDYEGEWETLWDGGKPETFPQETVHTIRIVPDRGGVAPAVT